MNILYLGNENKKIINFLKKKGNLVVVTQENLTEKQLENINYIISFGYKSIISGDIVDCFRKKAINLHISYLPWNKGADPNLWSFLENTPKGVSIHYIDKKLDIGEILNQKEIEYYSDDTLKTTYDRLITTIEDLFIETWDGILNNEYVPLKQQGGSYHNLKDKEPYLFLLNDGWDTKVRSIVGQAKGKIK